MYYRCFVQCFGFTGVTVSRLMGLIPFKRTYLVASCGEFIATSGTNPCRVSFYRRVRSVLLRFSYMLSMTSHFLVRSNLKGWTQIRGEIYYTHPLYTTYILAHGGTRRTQFDIKKNIRYCIFPIYAGERKRQIHATKNTNVSIVRIPVTSTVFYCQCTFYVWSMSEYKVTRPTLAFLSLVGLLTATIQLTTSTRPLNRRCPPAQCLICRDLAEKGVIFMHDNRSETCTHHSSFVLFRYCFAHCNYTGVTIDGHFIDTGYTPALLSTIICLKDASYVQRQQRKS